MQRFWRSVSGRAMEDRKSLHGFRATKAYPGAVLETSSRYQGRKAGLATFAPWSTRMARCTSSCCACLLRPEVVQADAPRRDWTFGTRSRARHYQPGTLRIEFGAGVLEISFP